MKKFDIFYFSGTHWDREWYQDAQSYRYRLVRMIDRLLDLFDKDPEYQTFHFDGQTIVLEDYTEIRPEMKEKLRGLIKDRKILIGPWYVMPDEFLVSGESLIRNLMKGHKLASEWGTEAWKYGYICDIFGHIAQMPQIFKGFGINYSALGRGMTEGDPAFFRWQAPDGTEVYNFTLDPDHGYASYYYTYRFEEDKSVNNPKVLENIRGYIDAERARSAQPIVVLMDAIDHSEASVHTTDYIKKIAEMYPDANVHHINLCEQGEMLEKYHDELPVICGEINKTAQMQHSYLHLITHTLSSYYTIKKENDECQNLLEKETEPLCALARLEGVNLDRSFVNVAYKHLLQNHPHDSICGCSVDQVHMDMKYRFAQAKEISNVMQGDFYDRLVRKDDKDLGDEYESILTLHNVLPFDVTRTVTVDIEFEPEYPTQYQEPFGYEFINSFKIFDAEDNEIPYQVVDIKRGSRRRLYNLPNEVLKDIHTVSFKANLPACAMTEYKIVQSKTPVRYLKKMKSGMNYAENEYIRLDILANGSLQITDKKTGKVYTKLGNLVDDGEIGDGWFHANPVKDSAVNSVGCAAVIEKVESGPSRCVFKVTRYMEVPEEVITDTFGKRRSDNKVTLKIETYVGLSEESRYVDVALEYDNIAKDHRLRLMIPTGIENDKYFAGQAFYCCERKTSINYDTATWRETDPYEKAMNGIVGKRDKDGSGIAFVSAAGLHECAGFDDDEGTIGVTLSRSFRKTVGTNGEVGGQINGKLSYKFLFAILDEDVEYADLLKMQDIMAAPLRPVVSNVKCGTKISPAVSKIEVGSKAIETSVIKWAEDDDALIVRVFNASEKESEGFISLASDIKKAELVTLNEEYVSDAKVEDNKVKFTLTPWRIATFKIYVK